MRQHLLLLKAQAQRADCFINLPRMHHCQPSSAILLSLEHAAATRGQTESVHPSLFIVARAVLTRACESGVRRPLLSPNKERHRRPASIAHHDIQACLARGSSLGGEMEQSGVNAHLHTPQNQMLTCRDVPRADTQTCKLLSVTNCSGTSRRGLTTPNPYKP